MRSLSTRRAVLKLPEIQGILLRRAFPLHRLIFPSLREGERLDYCLPHRKRLGGSPISGRQVTPLCGSLINSINSEVFMGSGRTIYKSQALGRLEKWVTRLAGFIFFAIIAYAMFYFGIHKKNIDLAQFEPLFYVAVGLLSVKLAINLLAPRRES